VLSYFHCLQLVDLPIEVMLEPTSRTTKVEWRAHQFLEDAVEHSLDRDVSNNGKNDGYLRIEHANENLVWTQQVRNRFILAFIQVVEPIFPVMKSASYAVVWRASMVKAFRPFLWKTPMVFLP
jgi:uncharacterized protein (DUF924 family)